MGFLLLILFVFVFAGWLCYIWLPFLECFKRSSYSLVWFFLTFSCWVLITFLYWNNVPVSCFWTALLYSLLASCNFFYCFYLFWVKCIFNVMIMSLFVYQCYNSEFLYEIFDQVCVRACVYLNFLSMHSNNSFHCRRFWPKFPELD